MKEQLFIELIRVSIGTEGCLSHTPSAKEWMSLYKMAKKQSLVGICFAGVQKLQAQHQAPPEMLYLQWMGMAAKIQQRSEVVNRQCAELGERLEVNGYRYAILKGQGVASLYNDPLSDLRQSGDIDVWIDGDIDDTIKKLREVGGEMKNVNIKHAEAEFFSDTQVEVHFIPSWFYNPIVNRRFKKWVDKLVRDERLVVRGSDSEKNTNHSTLTSNQYFNVPSAEFNLVFLLLHIYRHLFDEGVGLRQVMDYYMLLRNCTKELHGSSVEEFQKTLKKLGLLKFAGALLWVIEYVFMGSGSNLSTINYNLGIKPNEILGRKLLDEIMRGGNFGKFDEGKPVGKQSDVARVRSNMQRNFRFLMDYPSEVLWAPIWKLWHWGWRVKHGY